MPALKTHCPECNVKLRLTVEGEGKQKVKCPHCGHTFIATPDANESPTKEQSKAATSGKGGKQRAEIEEEKTPKKRRKSKGKAAEGRNAKLLIAGAVVGVLLLGVGIYAIASKNRAAKKTDTPTEAAQQQPTGSSPSVPSPNPVPSPKPASDPGPKPKDPAESEFATALPAPPKLRFSGISVAPGKPIVKAPAIPPLSPDEDPFVRAKEFKPNGPLPTLPKLPPIAQRPILTLDSGGHTDTIYKVFFTPKGDRVITIARDKAVRIWDPTTNDPIKTIRFPAGPGHEGTLQAAAISPSGKRLAVSGQPLANVTVGKVPIYILSPETGTLISRIDAASNTVNCLHFSNDSNRLAVGCTDGVVQVFDVSTPNKTLRLYSEKLTTGESLSIAFNPIQNTNFIATLGADKSVTLLNVSNPNQQRKFPIKDINPISLAWSNSGRDLAVGSWSGVIQLFTLEGQLIKSLPALSYRGSPIRIVNLRFLPGDRELVLTGVGNGGWAGVIDADTGEIRQAFTEHTNTVTGLDISADGKKIVSCGGNHHEIYVWSQEDGKILNKMLGEGNSVWAIAWAKDGKSLAWGMSSTQVGNADLPLQYTFRLEEFGVGDPPDPAKFTRTFSSDDHVNLITASDGILVQTKGRELMPIRINGGEKVYAATVLPKGNAVAVVGTTSVVLINPATGRESLRYIGHTGNVQCVTPSPDGRLFATGSSDQTIRIWQRDMEEPLLSLFIVGREWIAWTPQGYYTCSAQGERLIAWQVNAGKTPQIHAAGRFRASLYQPALLKYLIPAGDLPRALAMAQKYDKALTETTSVADVLPPEVTLDGFGDSEVKVDKDTITVKAAAKSTKHPITAMRLLLNGRPFLGAAGVKKFENPQNAAEATWEVPLPPGTHTFAVIADSAVSKGISKVGVAVRPGEPPKPNLYVLAIGISDYPGSLKLPYAASDAQLLAKAFQEKSKSVFARIEVNVLIDKQATKQGIRGGLDWLKSKMTAQDVGIVTFSGQAAVDKARQYYLIPADPSPNEQLLPSLFAGDEFKRRLDEMPGRLVAIFDTGLASGLSEKTQSPGQADSLVRDLTAEDSGVIVMCASQAREFRLSSDLTKSGVYAFSVAEGLSGHGDIDGDGVLYIHELHLYAAARVRQLTSYKQNPTFGRPPNVRPFPIAKSDKPPAP